MTTSTALTVQSKYQVAYHALTRAEPALDVLLKPYGMAGARMVRVALDMLQRTPFLLECEPKSIVRAVVQSAELGLEVGSPLGHAYLVPFKEKGHRIAKLIPGYQGLITLAYDEPRIVGVRADHVHENDVFEEIGGTRPELTHTVDRFKDRGRIQGVYGCVQIRDGWPIFRVLTLAEVDKIRDGSLAKIAESWQRDRSPWVTSEGEMQLKSALRRVLKYVPLGSRLRRAIELDAQEHGEPQTDPKGRAAELRVKLGVTAAAVGDDVIDAEFTETP